MIWELYGVNHRQGDHSLTHSFLPIVDGELHGDQDLSGRGKAKKGLAVGLRLCPRIRITQKVFKSTDSLGPACCET